MKRIPQPGEYGVCRAKVLGAMLEDIITSKKLPASFKTYLLEVAIRSHIKLQRDRNLADVASSFMTAVIQSAASPTAASYRVELRNVFGRIDHRMRDDAAQFEKTLAASLA